MGELGVRIAGCGKTVSTVWKASKERPPHKPAGGGGGGNQGGGVPGCTPYVWTDSSGWPHMEWQC
jgi:hypothetical protein